MIVSAVLLIIVGFAAVVAAEDTNVALNKPAYLSRQYTVSYPDVTADKAVDGNTNQDFDQRSCFHTFNDAVNWWYVDLQDIYRIKEVKVYNRLESGPERARNITVLVGKTLNSLKQVAYVPGQIDDIHSFVMPCGTKGRYVKLVQAANDYFHLCEVQVFAPAVQDINVALNKPANLSRQYTVSYPDVTADKAVDGNTSQDFDLRSCFHTFNDAVNWWYVDLQDIYAITEVIVYNRLESGPERARNITVLVGNTLNYMKQVAHVPGQIDDIHFFVMPCGIRGRYVKLVQAANDYFHLCEVQVFVPAVQDINVALNKPAALSRQYTVSYPDVTADKAVDGNTNQDFDQRSCFHTFNDAVNWWYVDLQLNYTITEVRVYNRLESGPERARNITVLVGNTLNSMVQVAHVPGQIDDIHSFVMPVGTKGRYVKLVQAANDYFHLCEVQVFAPADEKRRISDHSLIRLKWAENTRGHIVYIAELSKETFIFADGCDIIGKDTVPTHSEKQAFPRCFKQVTLNGQVVNGVTLLPDIAVILMNGKEFQFLKQVHRTEKRIKPVEEALRFVLGQHDSEDIFMEFPVKTGKNDKVVPWTEEQSVAMRRAFAKNLRCLTVPNKGECEEAMKNERVLLSREWKNAKFRVYYEIQRLKQK